MERNDHNNEQEFNANSTDQTNSHTNEDTITNDTQESSPGIAQSARESNYAGQRNKPKQKSGAKSLMSGIIGGVISAVIVALLFTTNVIPLNNGSSDNAGNSADSGSNNNSASPEVVQTMSKSENADEVSNLQEATEAVVGVVNLQQQSVWSQGKEAGTGSGIIYKKENGKAYVVTNQHVVEGAEEVEVVLGKDSRVPAKVLGGDPLTDLAVLQIDGKHVDTVAELGTSENLKVGTTVYAIGNPLGMNFANSLTKGIISGLDRSVSIDTNGDKQADWVTEVIQTDAAINPGNSGGALVNANGEVIGINSMKIANTKVEGIGFAIPINSALPIMKQLEEDGDVARPFIGISTAPLGQVPPQYRDQIQLPEGVKGGMVVAQVQSGSPAAEANLQQFDVITKINGNEITSILDLRKYLYTEAKIGEKVQLEIYRNGEPQTIEIELAAREQ
ncbi:S1C family serine protease [Virgibacillus kekensis]|uniref:S1C family serine protease n=1 Tax=Virgibacillus kekensis TaxID=202261 RepID=A0ABV9DMS1_9BACI